MEMGQVSGVSFGNYRGLQINQDLYIPTLILISIALSYMEWKTNRFTAEKKA